MRIFILLYFFFSNALLFSQFSFPGDGSVQNPYEIWTLEHWNELTDSSYYYFYNGNRSWAKDKHIHLMQDINNISQPLYSYSICYFNGKNKIITEDVVYNFFWLPGGIIDSLTVNGYTNSSGGKFGVGSNNIVTNCINNIPVVDFGYEGVYGIMIYQAGGITSTNHGTISHCINNGDVSGVDRIAGIVSTNSETASHCINTGKITASNSGSDNWDGGGIGGIFALNVYSINSCINLGDVVGQNNVGGIGGMAVTNSGFSPPCTITNSINAGYIKGNSLIGGIVGKNFYISGSPSVISNCVNTGVIEGEEDVGTIVGKE